jgi:hypothetical protein
MSNALAALMGVLSGTPQLEAGLEENDKQQLKQAQLDEEKRRNAFAESQATTPVSTLYKTLGLETPANVAPDATVPTHLAPTAMATLEREQARRDEAAQMKGLTDSLTKASTKTETTNAPLAGAMGGEGGSRPYDEQTTPQTKTTVTDPRLYALKDILPSLGLKGAAEVVSKIAPDIGRPEFTPPTGFRPSEVRVDSQGKPTTYYKPDTSILVQTLDQAKALRDQLKAENPNQDVTLHQHPNGGFTVNTHPTPAAMQGTAITDEALDKVAQYVIESGSLPSGFSRDRETIRKVMNRVAEIESGVRQPRASSTSMAGTKADYTANADALKNFEKNAAQISLSEGTARGAADQALERSRTVDRTGVPVLNRWLIAGRQSIAGDPDVAAFNVAVETLKQEYIKVMTTNTGGGGQMNTDSAQRRMDHLLDMAQAPQQFDAAINQMKNDMAIRMRQVDQTRGEIRGRVRSGGGQQQSPNRNGGAAPAADPLGIR